MSNNIKYTGLEVAIIGMSCRFPGAPDHRTYWKNLVAGIESVSFFSEEELRLAGMKPEVITQKEYVGAGAVMQEKEYFDSAFFGYRPSEAALLNPEHRMFLQCAWEAMEDAGYVPDGNSSVGVFAGAGEDINWRLYTTLKNEEQQVDALSQNHLGNKDYLSTLIAHRLNLMGPAVTINTACSSSLMAVNLACRSLWLGESKMALAGGVTLSTMRDKGYIYEEGMINSKDGHCRAFDEEASGCIGGEGAGVVVLKRLSDAVKDGDHIYAVIQSAAANNDGSNKVGFTAPGVQGQSECIQRALALGRIDPASICYIEAHGTGTRLGDPIELAALNTVFRNCPPGSCAIGSVKTNIGHLDTAAGVAGLIKTALSLYYEKIPPSLHYRKPNPAIHFSEGPFYVNAVLSDWPRREGQPLRAGVSSFGIGGTNVHVVLQQAPAAPKPVNDKKARLLAISGKSRAALERNTKALQQYLSADEDANLEGVSYTMNTGRKHFPYRHFAVFETRDELFAELSAVPDEGKDDNGGALKMVWLFPGQSVQYTNMCRELYLQDASFRTDIDQGLSILAQLNDLPYKATLFPDEGGIPGNIQETRFTQPLVFLVEYALGQLLIRLGLRPDHMIGHSLGEFTAATLAGVFNLQDALKIIVARAGLMDTVPGGRMLSVHIKEHQAAAYLKEGVWLSAINGPDQAIFSGTAAEMEAFGRRLDQEGVAFTELQTSHAFHSGMMDPILESFGHVFGSVTLNKPIYPVIGNLTGEVLTEEQICSAEYWVQHLREPVLFRRSVQKLLSLQGRLLFIEVGPGTTLSSLVRQQVTDQPVHLVNLIPGRKKKENDHTYFLKALGTIWKLGMDIRWGYFYQTGTPGRVSLPTYSFEKMKYPVEVDPASRLRGKLIPAPDAVTLKESLYFPSWKRELSAAAPSESTEHVYLLFSSGDEISQRVSNELSARGRVVEVLPGSHYQRLGPAQFQLDNASGSGISLLLSDLAKEGAAIDYVVYAWHPEGYGDEVRLTEDADAFMSHLMIPARIFGASVEQPLTIRKGFISLTRLMHQTLGVEAIDASQCLMLGLLHCAQQEQGILCKNIDIDPHEDIALVSAKVAGEIATGPAGDRIVSFRLGQRWVPSFQRNQAEMKAGAAIRRNGLFLMAGGMGRVGRVLSKLLVDTYGASLAIVGRRSSDELTTKDLQWLSSLRSGGSSVNYYSSDLADEDRFQSTVQRIEKEMGVIHGVVGTAGDVNRVGFELAEDLTASNAATVMMPKVMGVQNLKKVFGRRQLDFVWLSGSLSSLLGGAGFSAYASGHAFLEYFLIKHAGMLPNWRCVALGELESSDMDSVPEYLRDRRVLRNTELAELFQWTVNAGLPAVIYQTWEDFHTRFTKVFSPSVQTGISETVQPEQSPIHIAARPQLKNEYCAPESQTEEALVGLLAGFFGIGKVGVLDSILELGGDSLKAMILIKKIRNQFSVDLSIQELFEADNIRNIALQIDEKVWMNTNTEASEVVII